MEETQKVHEMKYTCPYCQKPKAFDFTDLMRTEAMIPMGQVMKQRCYTCGGQIHLTKTGDQKWEARRHADITPQRRRTDR